MDSTFCPLQVKLDEQQVKKKKERIKGIPRINPKTKKEKEGALQSRLFPLIAAVLMEESNNQETPSDRLSASTLNYQGEKILQSEVQDTRREIDKFSRLLHQGVRQ